MTTPDGTEIIGKRYILNEKLGSGGMGTVFLAQDRLTGAKIALKKVIPVTDPTFLSPEESEGDYRLALAQEFKVLASLRHPHVISVIDYGFDEDRQPFYTMELLSSAATLLEAGEVRSVEKRTELLMQVLQALVYLHRRGIIHRDLKPRNVLVEKDQVKVLDFGLSVVREQSGAVGNTSGTLAYMAPEVLTNGMVTESADLYAVGVMGYELFIGKHPFDTGDVTLLINNILYAYPNMAPLEAINPRLSLIIQRLLARSPESRYSSAAAVVQEIRDALGIANGLETSATRESFLQAARFVGRSKEVQTLTEALEKAIAGQGSAWLIGGESGVGKSRLIDELRTLAMVRGAYVLRGQAVSEGSAPYSIWRPVLRWLSISSELDMETLEVLKLLVPDIEALIGKNVEAKEIDARTIHNRVLQVVEKLFRKQQTLLVIILEDLHWANEDLDILAHLSSIISDLPIILVGSYRDDEVADLPSRLPNMSVLKLQRLSENEISQLSEAMLGESGKLPHVVDLLQRETEGNVFFLVEVVRVLAEEAGQLDRIGLVTLPAQVFAGGVQQVIERRLSHIPQKALASLQIAAVMGRQLDLEALAKLEPELDIEQWLTDCSDAAVLEVYDEDWRFVHDRFRDGILSILTPEKRIKLHGRVAVELELLHPNETEYAPILAYHFGSAVNLHKEAEYTLRAGEHALKNGAFRNAIHLLERYLQITSLTEFENRSAEQEINVKRLVAEARLGLGEYQQAKQVYGEILVTSNQSGFEKGVAWSFLGLGDIAHAQDNYDEAEQFYQKCLEIYRKSNAQTEVARTLNRLGNVADEMGDTKAARTFFQESLNLSREVGSGWGMAGSIRQAGHSDSKKYLDTLDSFQKTIIEATTTTWDANILELFHSLETVSTEKQYSQTADLYNDALKHFQDFSPSWGGIVANIYLGRLELLKQNKSEASKYLVHALESVKADVKALTEPFTMILLLSVSKLLAQGGEDARSIELLGFVSSSNDTDLNDWTQDEAETAVYELESRVAADLRSKSWEAGKALQPDTVVKVALEGLKAVSNQANHDGK